jgi:hypothetical protein
MQKLISQSEGRIWIEGVLEKGAEENILKSEMK